VFWCGNLGCEYWTGGGVMASWGIAKHNAILPHINF
jgi:hypothetical protein